MTYRRNRPSKPETQYHLNLAQPELMKVPHATLAAIRAAIPAYAKSEIAEEQINKFLRDSHQRLPKSITQLIYPGIAIAGIFLFSGAARVATLVLPSSTQIPAQSLLAAAMAVFGEMCIKRVITALRLLLQRSQTIAELEREKEIAPNSLATDYKQVQITLIRKVEDIRLSPVDPAAAILLTLLEMGSAFFLAWEDGIVFAFFAAAIPITLIYACAASLSELIDMPHERDKRLREYQGYLISNDDNSESDSGILVALPPER